MRVACALLPLSHNIFRPALRPIFFITGSPVRVATLSALSGSPSSQPRLLSPTAVTVSPFHLVWLSSKIKNLIPVQLTPLSPQIIGDSRFTRPYKLVFLHTPFFFFSLIRGRISGAGFGSSFFTGEGSCLPLLSDKTPGSPPFSD